MATLDDINHDSGSPLTDHWDSVTNSSGRMGVAVAAALNGSTEGLNVTYGASGSARLNEPFTSPASEELNLLFYFDPNGAGTPTSADRTLIQVNLNHNGSATGFILVAVAVTKRTDGIIRAGFTFGEDGGGGGTAGNFDITDAPHSFRLTSKRASSAIANDGEYQFFVDEDLKFSATNIDNYDLFPTILYTFVNFPSLESAMSGTTLYADEFLLTDALPILSFSGYDLVLGGGQP